MSKIQTRSTAAATGLISGALLGVGAYFLIRRTDVTPTAAVAAGLILLAVVLILYIVAAMALKPSASHESHVTSACRGLLISVNSTCNFVIAWQLMSALLGAPGIFIGGALGGITLIACIGAVSGNAFYQGVIGWLDWLLPMSWLVIALGLVFALASVLLHLIITLPFGATFTRVGGKSGSRCLDGATGTFFQHGGLVANCNPLKTAFNMGNIAFVHKDSTSAYYDHEAGHTLNLAAFGSLFHFIGAIEQMINGHRAFAELLAESNDTAGHNQLAMW
jgi:phage shock protein PspC (stress-responsive transcriptional regulator)